jgi:hypothetical protein
MRCRQVFMSHAAPALSAMQQALSEGKVIYVHCAQVRNFPAIFL